MTTTEITTQEIFNRVRDHLLAQGAPSMRYFAGDDDQQCAYRGSDGLKCAIGALISDAHYSPALESCGAHDLPVADAVCASLGIERLSRAQKALLSDLQYTHDDYDPTHWAEQLDTTASYHGLVP